MVIAMPELDKIKEEIAHLRMWLGVLLVADISVFGWAVSNYGSVKNILIVLAVNGIMALSVMAFFVNRRIETTIKRLGDL